MAEPRHLALPSFARWTSVREEVAKVLRGAIISGEMRPGELYSAASLAERFGISATPVREAMLDLAKQGLVEAVRNRGYKVTEISEADLDEITQIRLLLEPPVVADVAGTIPPAGLTALRALADAIVAAAREGDLAAYLAADRDFHAEVLRYAGNAQLVDLATSLRMKTRMYGLKILSESNRLADSAHEHHELLDLLEAGDGAAALALMRRHISHARGLWATGEQEPPPQEKS